MEGRIETCEKLINTISPVLAQFELDFLKWFYLKFDFVVLIRVVDNPLSFQMLLVSFNLEV